MDRREFLKLLGLGAIVTATPKIIFDMGKNSRIYRIADLPSKFKIYTDPHAIDENQILMGYKGKETTDQILLYCPYVPLQFYDQADKDRYLNASPNIVATRYGNIEIKRS